MIVVSIPRRIARRVPARGRGDMAELRGWSRLLRWQGLTPSERRRAMRDATFRAWVTLRAARRGVRRYGTQIEQLSGVPRWRQGVDLWWLGMRYGVDPVSYRDKQLYRPERRARAGDYLLRSDYLRVMRHLGQAYEQVGDGPRLRDKREFAVWCAEHGLPAVPVIAEWKGGTLVFDARPSGALPPHDLFSKPPDATYGCGTARWRYDGQGGYVGRDGRARSAAELMEELAEVSRVGSARRRKRSHRMLLMRCLHNDSRLAAISNGALCTARVVTYRRPGGQAEFLAGAYKMGTGDAPADNFYFGGLIAPVDGESGRVGVAVQQRGQVFVPVERHPDTGAVIEGHYLPHWHEARALALRAHDAARAVPSVGWDIGLTPEGPVLIEGNQWSDPDVAETARGMPLADTPYVAALNEHLRAVLAKA